ncbi:MAG: hypothetical protein LBJ10_05630, partial [Clostridiales bacterium]|nr:hypothetical protein [Clostridiales bacterium]
MLGNEAVARGAYEAGVAVATAYPGTPSTEITECIAKYEQIYCEWSPNEKVALEVALGASIAGARAICSMKHVGLNVAADPLFTAAYTGVNAGLVIVVADDPGMHSSQNEQDSRYYGLSAKVPVLEPADSAECLEFAKLAFELSEAYDTPAILRLTTRVAHSRSLAEASDRQQRELRPYEKNVAKYVMMPAMARLRRVEAEGRMRRLEAYAEVAGLNRVEDFGAIPGGNACNGGAAGAGVGSGLGIGTGGGAGGYAGAGAGTGAGAGSGLGAGTEVARLNRAEDFGAISGGNACNGGAAGAGVGSGLGIGAGGGVGSCAGADAGAGGGLGIDTEPGTPLPGTAGSDAARPAPCAAPLRPLGVIASGIAWQ